MRTPLSCALMLAASAYAVPAFALPNDTKTLDVKSEVLPYCSEFQVSENPMNLGNLADPNGELVSDFRGAPEPERVLSASFYCNAPAKITIQADPLVNSAVPMASNTESFTNRVDYTAVLKWRELQGSASSTAASGQELVAPQANIGSLSLSVTDPVVSQNRRPVAGTYSGRVLLTVSLTQ